MMDKKTYFEALKKGAKEVEGKPGMYYHAQDKMLFRKSPDFDEKTIFEPEPSKKRSKAIMQKKAVLDKLGY